MAQQDILLPGIEHDTQGVEYWCGPACINMVLSYWDKQQPKAVLWESIKINTGSQYRPADAPEDDGSFKTQQCDACGSGGYHCWYTTPEAMEKTINGLAPETFSATYQGAQDAIRRMADSLSDASPVPAVFTTLPALHWVVAVGYQLEGSGDSIVWNGQKLTGLYVRDPVSDPGIDVTQLTTIAGLLQPLIGLVMAVECGPKAGQYPVVAKGTPAPAAPPAAPQNVRVLIASTWQDFSKWLFRTWLKWFKPQQPPRRPPRPPR